MAMKESDVETDTSAKLTREQVTLSTLIGDGLMDPTPTRSIAERADLIVRWMLREPDVVRRALASESEAPKLITGCEPVTPGAANVSLED